MPWPGAFGGGTGYVGALPALTVDRGSSPLAVGPIPFALLDGIQPLQRSPQVRQQRFVQTHTPRQDAVRLDVFGREMDEEQVGFPVRLLVRERQYELADR